MNTAHPSPPIGRSIAVAVAMLLAVTATAGLGVLTNQGNVDGWYQQVSKVAWSPPNWLFAPAWTTLYALIALSGFMLWRSGYRGQRHPNAATSVLKLFAGQQVMNALWSPVFFAGYPAVGKAAWWIALLIIAALIVAVAIVIVRSWPISPVASGVLVPYLAWLTFAATLNAGIIALN